MARDFAIRSVEIGELDVVARRFSRAAAKQTNKINKREGTRFTRSEVFGSILAPTADSPDCTESAVDVLTIA